MAQLPTTAVGHLAARHGVISRRQLIGFGVSADQIYRRVASRRLIEVHAGVYRSGEVPDGELARCVAACLVDDAGVISHTTAARLWGLRCCSGSDTHLTVPSEVRVRAHGITVHRSVALAAADVVHRADGIRVTSPVRTVCDLAALLGDDALASVLEQVLDVYDLRFATFRAVAERVLERRPRGAARLRRLVERRPAGARAQESDLEVRLASALVRAGLPAPVRQLVVRAGGSDARFDLAYPERGLAIEVDHRVWHAGGRVAKDKQRDRRVAAAGFTTLRVTEDDLAARALPATVAEIVAVYRQRAGAAAVAGRGA